MMNQNSFILSEGYKPMGIALAISVFSFLFICDTLGFIALFAFLFLGYIHRNSIIGFIPKDENIIVSPIEGVISAIDFSKHTQKIYIDVNICDNHILRAPKNGKFTIKKLIHGINLPHDTLKAKKLNTRATLKFDDIKIKLLSGLCNKDLSFESVEEVNISDKIGLFFHGQVCVEIPNQTYQVTVKIGQKVSYETVVAQAIESN